MDHRPSPDTSGRTSNAPRVWAEPRAKLRAWEGRTFISLRNRNYRAFFIGQAVSMCGTWMQLVAQSWLVLQLTGSSTALGVVVAVQTLPVLLVAPYGGLIVDRTDKRRLLMTTQFALMALALLLGLLTLTHVVRLWSVMLIAGVLGLTNSIDNPARQAFVPEMVGPDSVANAVSLNSVMTNGARALGPAVGGLIIVGVGVGECFLLNALSFIAIIIALLRMRTSTLHPAAIAKRRPGQLIEGLRYVRRTPTLVVPLLMMGLIGALSYEFQVVLPVLASTTFHGNADAYGFLTAVFGVGAMAGGLWVAGRPSRGLRPVVLAAGAFGVALLAAAAAPALDVELVMLACVGAASVAFMSRGNSLLQLTSDPSMRGRVMALWSVALVGTTPFGGPIIGFVCEVAGARWGLATGGVAALLACTLALHHRLRRRLQHESAVGTAVELPPGTGPT